MSLKLFVYENSSISFNDGEKLMVNATEMAKSFGKRPSEWLRLPSTDAFLTAYEAMGKSHRSTLIRTENGVATWFHEDVAIEFARWLSPSFAIWCNDRIKELLKHGLTATPAKIEEMLANPDTMIATLTALKAERAEVEQTRERLTLANTTIQLQAPKVEYCDTVLLSQTLIKTDLIAMQIGVSAPKLNKMLIAAKIQFKRGPVYYLYSEYRDLGLSDYKTHTYTDTAGRQCTTQHMYWTEKGRKFLMERFASKSIAA